MPQATPAERPVATLTAREREVLERVTRVGRKGAALSLGVSVHTVDWHLRTVYRKLAVDGLPAAARLLGQAERP